MEYSARIYGIYLNYVAKEDIHVYSVDECFMDVTRYLSLYHLTAKEMAQKLMDAVMEETGITATAGIGTNLYLAKIAMDIVAKHIEDHIGILDEISYREQLWEHKPLSDFWRIGSRTERKLAGYGIQTMGDIALASIQSEDWLYKMFGIDAELLIDHAWGCESCRMSDIKNYRTEEHSLSNGQVLMRNYTFEEAAVVVREMTDVLVLDLVEKGLVTNSVTLWIAYDHRFERESSKGTVRFPDRTNRSREMIDTVETLYRKIADPHTGIRRIEIIANKITPEGYQQYTLFQDSIKAEDFTTSHADTYKTVYYVEPVNQEHPNYQISRNVTVKEIEKVSELPSIDAEQSETKEPEEDEADSEKPLEVPTETPDVSEGNAAFDALVEQMTEQDTFDRKDLY